MSKYQVIEAVAKNGFVFYRKLGNNDESSKACPEHVITINPGDRLVVIPAAEYREGCEVVVVPPVESRDEAVTRIVAELNERQKRSDVHPYTCGNDSRHRPLVATPTCWKCEDCDYRQPHYTPGPRQAVVISKPEPTPTIEPVETDEEFVKRRYPGACTYRWQGKYSISDGPTFVAAQTISGVSSATPELAWASAAEKIREAEAAKPLALDVSLETARALHRVWRALNDGDCPKCHRHQAATDMVRTDVSIVCPSCGFLILHKEIEEIEEMFAPAMDAAVAIFEKWKGAQ